jgi:hypothetical protein
MQINSFQFLYHLLTKLEHDFKYQFRNTLTFIIFIHDY